MPDQATIVDFLSASLKGQVASGRSVLTPLEQTRADEIAVALDLELNRMVCELERVASCQQAASGGGSGEPLPPFEAFCVGLQSIGNNLLPHLVTIFRAHYCDNDIPYGPYVWIVRARVDAFVAYLLQIAQVHGLAFDDTLTKMGKNEQIALANLGAYLRALMQKEIESL